MDLATLLAAPPAIHLDADGRPWHLSVAEEIMHTIDAAVDARSRTLETGAGLSTVLFALRGAAHTCVAPIGAELERIRDWCAAHGVSTERVTFCEQRSELALPALGDAPLDLVLIDGAHAFPAPFIDWYYAGRRLRRGGLLIVDDTQLWTGRVLRTFLREQPGWELVRNLPNRAAVFQRTGEGDEPGDWVAQPFVRRRSLGTAWPGWASEAVQAAGLLRQREFAALAARVRRRVGG